LTRRTDVTPGSCLQFRDRGARLPLAKVGFASTICTVIPVADVGIEAPRGIAEPSPRRRRARSGTS
jgi:hypothetical protein